MQVSRLLLSPQVVVDTCDSGFCAFSHSLPPPLAAVMLESVNSRQPLRTEDLAILNFINQSKEAYTFLYMPLYFGSSSWARTNDPAVNSRMLYRLSY